jgi:Zn finger protein HypA/HybF involved in hydrogenase expression
VGGALCSGCKLHITVTIHTARCAKCNYELENLKAERCPECGEPIPAGSTGLGEAT